jgi:hypothetical protein
MNLARLEQHISGVKLSLVEFNFPADISRGVMRSVEKAVAQQTNRRYLILRDGTASSGASLVVFMRAVE